MQLLHDVTTSVGMSLIWLALLSIIPVVIRLLLNSKICKTFKEVKRYSWLHDKNDQLFQVIVSTLLTMVAIYIVLLLLGVIWLN